MKVGPSLAGPRQAPGPVSAAPAGGPGGRVPDERRDGHRHHTTATENGRPGKALVLNATMEPLCVVSARRAVVLVLSAKADMIHHNGHRFRSSTMDVPAPSVVRLRSYVRVPYRRRAALSRRGVFLRDESTCQYCGRGAENVDHIHPRSRGGAHEWENVVAACRRCNSRKKDHTPEEAGMVLRRKPYAPRAAFWLVVAVGGVREDWADYLGDVLSAG